MPNNFIMAYVCVLKCGAPCKSSDRISRAKWESLESKSKNWSGLDKFGDIYESINWKNDPKNFYMHQACYISISSSDKLQKARKRKETSTESQNTAAEATTSAQSDIELEPLPPKRLRSSVSGTIHDKTKCVWCMREEDSKHPGRHRGKLYRLNTFSAWRSFKRHTLMIEDPEMKNRITKLIDSTSALSDPFANDIMYHHHCWLKYITNNCLKEEDALHLQSLNINEARSLFYRHVDSVIFKEHEIRSLQSLLVDYKRIIGDYGYAVGDIKSSYLKELLVVEYKDSIGFKERNERNKSELVFDAKGGGDYIQCAISSFGISDEQLIQNIAPRLSQEIRNTPSVPWPPEIEHLEESEELSPLLLKLLTLMRNPHRKSLDISPSTLSLASMITYHISGKRTATTINLGVNVHGMTRSRNLVDILHKSSVCISYADTQFLYDYWAFRDVEVSSSCPQEIADDKPAIVIIDNDDFKVDTLSGNAAGAHRTNVMFLQPKEYEKKSETPTTCTITKKDISAKLKHKCEELTRVQQYKCPPNSSSEPPIRPEVLPMEDSMVPQQTRSVIHTLCRVNEECKRPQAKDQDVPAYSGLQSCLQEPPLKSKPYYHLTYPEPPSKSVVHDVMIRLTTAMEMKRIPFVFLVGDMPTYKTITQLKAENPLKFINIIPIIGAFHQQMSFIYAIYKRFQGSGMADTLVAAGVVNEGSVDQALKGKHYRRAVRCILLFRETLIYMRLQKILVKQELSNIVKENLNTLRNSLKESKEVLCKAYNNLENSVEIKELVKKVYGKPGTDMGDFWISFLEMSDPLAQNIHACHIQDYEQYLTSTYEMLSGLMAYDNLEYGRWLPDYWAMLTNLPSHQNDYFKRHFTQSMTGLPYSCQPLDMWIETTMNLNSKLKQGWLHLLQNDKQLFSTTRNANNVARIKTHLDVSLKCQFRTRKHIECQPQRMIKDEEAIQDLVSCFIDFNADPFDSSNPTLRSLQSGVVAPSELVLDFSRALMDGGNQVKAYLHDRVFSKKTPICTPIKKNKRKNFASTQITRTSGLHINQLDMEKSGISAVLQIAESSGAITLENILESRVTEESLSLFNADGSFRKTAKSKILSHFNLQPIEEIPTSYLSLVDMGLIWRLSTPTAEDRECKRRDGVDYKWQDYLDKVWYLITSRHTNAKLIILVNDRYNMAFSIKDDEHDRRSAQYHSALNMFPKPCDKFLNPSEFNKFMANSDNKVRLQMMIKTDLIKKVSTDRIIYCDGETATRLCTGEEMSDYAFSQAEADTMLFSTYFKLRNSGYTDPVVLDSEDTDVYVQAAYVSQHIQGVLLIKRKRDFINCYNMLEADIANIIIAAHVISGSDHTSGFYGRGKKAMMKKLTADPEARELLVHVGDQPELRNKVKCDMETFVLTKMYGCPNDTTCAQARAAKWRKQKKKSTLSLPPDQESLHHHLQRTNYITYCQRHYDMSDHPSPLTYGWELLNGRCRPVRHKRAACPSSLPRLFSSKEDETESSDAEDSEDSDCGYTTDSDED